jgi:hypothetical protein
MPVSHNWWQPRDSHEGAVHRYLSRITKAPNEAELLFPLVV